MDEFGVGNTSIRRKRTQTCRRPKPEVQASVSSDDAGKISSDENAVDANPRRKVFNLNQCGSVGPSATRAEGEYSHANGGITDAKEEGLNHKQHTSNSRASDDGGGNEKILKKVKLKVGGVTRTIQPKATVGSSKNADAPRPRPKLILQDNSDEENSPPPPSTGKKIGLQGIPWKDFSRGGFSLGRDSMGKSNGGKAGDKSRKSKRVPKKRVLDGDFDEEEDDEIRYLEKLKTVKVAAASASACSSRDFDEDSSKKHRSLSRVSKVGKHESLEANKSKSESVSVDTEYEEEDVVSDHENGKKQAPESPSETKRETSLTSRQRALLSGRDSASGGSQIEFPNGLPPAPPRKQKEKLTEVEQQLKKAEAAERRRIQNEKAARESEAEAIRKILGQDSSRKKREDKLKKRQEELAQEKAANAKTLAPNTIRTVIGASGTVVAFAQDIGLPHILQPKPPTSYPPPREKCAGPLCSNAYKYRDSKSNLPLCSLQCYKAIHQTGC